MSGHKGFRRYAAFLAGLVGLLFWWQSLTALSALQGATRRNELYYTEPIPNTQAERARDYAGFEQNVSGLWPTFWCQNLITCDGAFHTDDVICIQYLGEATALWPFSLCSGTYPAGPRQALISTGLAQDLWGSDDVIGCTLRSGQSDDVAKVCGIFQSTIPMLCIWAASGTAFDHVMVCASDRTTAPDDFYTAAREFAVQSGLGVPQAIGWHSALVLPIRLFCWFPVLVTGLCLLLIFGKRFPSVRHKGCREIVGWLLALVAAFLLPAFLEALPSWLIPGQWSNFSFWQSLLETLQSRWQEQLVFPGSVFLGWQKEPLWKGVFCSITASVCLSIGLCLLPMEGHQE